MTLFMEHAAIPSNCFPTNLSATTMVRFPFGARHSSENKTCGGWRSERSEAERNHATRRGGVTARRRTQMSVVDDRVPGCLVFAKQINDGELLILSGRRQFICSYLKL
ncbi:hypothetical protein BC936DRAFT_143828 [Jimgerdemannia flammicorona]|uniref:Uncharacterized protein n=1 Tax=Jimgerdemannia flammicorona TaxID=994334 RepID=A0A432ZYS4_9FUNG|nr:hypothetical protein BC936DRAFT_143828 [Jimgerdemannia flammicorona]